jgi:hypothetical protein
VVRVPGYITEMYCVSCEVRNEFIYLYFRVLHPVARNINIIYRIYICYVEESRLPLWSSCQSSWLQIQRSGFDSRRYQICWELVGPERSPLSFVSTTEELLERKISGSCLENREYCRRDPLCWPRNTIYQQKLALTSPTSDSRSVCIVRSRT